MIGERRNEEKERDEDGEEEYMVENYTEGRFILARLSRFNVFSRKNIVVNGFCDFSSFIVLPNNRLYKAWEMIILVWALYSSFFTPMEFGFFRGLPTKLFFLDIVGQAAFLVDIFLQFFVAYRDSQTYKIVYKRRLIALRYLKSSFVVDLLSCMPWDVIYKACGNREEVRYLLWIRLYRARKVVVFFQELEKDIRINYLFTRILKLIAVEIYCTHTGACIFYYLATTLPQEQEGYTWIGSLNMGDYRYSHFREIDLWTRYLTSLYFAIVTMATVGYGEIHAVNIREMIFVMIYVSFDMILGAYLIGNMTALIVKGSKTERFRDKMTDLIKYMNRNRLSKDIRNQIKGHVRLQYESSYTEDSVLRDIPVSIRAKISQRLYKSYIESVPLFKGCSAEFINQIVIRVHEEFFLPGEVIIEQGSVVDQLYFVCHGKLEEVGIGTDGIEETVTFLEPKSLFGEISILCNIPQPYTVRVCELCRLLRVDKQSFSNILDIYFHDGRRILNNLLEGKESNIRLKQLESDITFHIGQQEAELALRVNCAAYHGDLQQMKCLIKAGADSNMTDYDGRSPLHLAASRGYEDIILFLIKEGVDINISGNPPPNAYRMRCYYADLTQGHLSRILKLVSSLSIIEDKFGNTPLLEALRNRHDRVASVLVKTGATLNVDDVGSFTCAVVAKGDSDFLKRILSNGIDPNTKDYDHRTPLHVAASKGSYWMAKLLLEAGASVFTTDRWGNTPFDEAQICGNKNLIKLLEDAKNTQQSQSTDLSQEITAIKWHSKKCTVFPFHPWNPKDKSKHGIVMWVPQTITELIGIAKEQLEFPHGSYILSEDAGKILDVNMISDGQKLYLIGQTH